MQVTRAAKVWACAAAAALAAAAGVAGGAAATGWGGGHAPPTPVLQEAPPYLTTTSSARFSFSGVPGVRFECRRDDAAAAPCTSPVAYQTMDGAHRFSVVAVDARGRRSEPVQRAWFVDTGAPAAPRLVEAPPAVTRSTRARFVVAAEEGARTRCTLDGTHVRCRVDHLGLGEGEHRFSATALDAAGNRGPAAEHVWRIDTTPPAAPEIESGGGPPFAFTGEAGATFLCALDSGPALACASPHTYPGPFTDGRHTFTVRARDAAGNAGPAATMEWTFDARPYRTTVLAQPGLTGYWRLGETQWGPAAAESGADGAYTGGVTLGVAGAFARDPDPAAEFDGVSGEALLPGPVLRESGTLEGWFHWTGGIAALRDHTSGNGWILGLRGSGGMLACRAGVAARTATSSTVSVDGLAGSWHHLAMTKDGLTVTCYLDGKPVASRDDATTNVASVAPWHLMNNGTVTEQYARGRADDIAIYGHALKEEDIKAHYLAGRPQ